jgi:hypothetical protein
MILPWFAGVAHVTADDQEKQNAGRVDKSNAGGVTA